ncbi:Scavenger receptor cysteine-rich type 1 M130 [Paramuricea clavata]|uniref:Scavenger receptor cysteine-rich type 1 M130 n=1 Tax=Paramuricea clavata TaxID=317549 RepID=A0A7D9EH85_PARCT|nr:Scavenger receptor cysteine-rich type 1 M130 [Paramuricea clavata]
MDTAQTITGMSLLHNLSTSSKGKLKWTADFEALQRFVAEVLVLSDGEWTTPGGHAKLYQNESISIRWYSDTESITISGKDEKEFKEKLLKLASISAGLANDEDKLVDVVEKNRSVSHNDNKSHPNNDLDDSQETYLKILNCQLQAKLQALSDQFVSSMTYINRTLSDHSNQLKELRIADKESSAVNALLTDNVNISNQDTLKRKYKSKKSNKKSKTSEKQSQDEQRCITDSPAKTTQTSQPINEVSNVNKNTTSSPKSIQSPSKKVTVVAGDSILKHVEGWRLSNASNHAVVKSFSGATTSDMEDYLRPVLRKEPNKIILHIGTNDINYQTAQTVAEGVLNLGIQITQDSPTTDIVISGILPRTDKPNLMSKVNQANRLIKAFCIEKNWAFLDHESFNSTCLNSRGLHLNRKGTSILARNISKYISTD